MPTAIKHDINGQGYYSVRNADGSTTLIIARDSGDAFARALGSQNIDPRTIPGSIDHHNSFDALQKATGANNIYPDSTSTHLGGARGFQTVRLPAGVDHAEYMRATYGNVTPNGQISRPSLLQSVSAQAVPNPVVQSAATAASDIQARLGSTPQVIAAEAMHPSLGVGQAAYDGPVRIQQTEAGRFSYTHEGLPNTQIDVRITPGANPGEVRVNMSTTVGRQTQQALSGITGSDYEKMLTDLKRQAAGDIGRSLGVNTQSAISTGSFSQTLSGQQLEPAARRVEEHRTAQRRGGDIAQAAINDTLRQTGASPQAAEMVRGVTGTNAPEAPRATINPDGSAHITGNMPDRAGRTAGTGPINPESGLGRALAAAEPPRAPTIPTPDEAAVLRQPAQGAARVTPERAPQSGAAFQQAAARMLAEHEARSPRPTETTVRPANPIAARFDQAAETIRASAPAAPPAAQTATARPTAPDGTIILTQEEIAARRAAVRQQFEAQQAAKAGAISPASPTPSATAETPKPIMLGREGGLGGQHGLAPRDAVPPSPPAERTPSATQAPESPTRVIPSTAQATPDRPVAAGEQGPFVRQGQAPHAPTGAAAAAHVAEEAAANAPSIGRLTRSFLGRAASKIPVIGALAAGGMAAANMNEARAAYQRGEIDEKQLAAVVAGGTATTATSLGGFVTGTATEEAVVAAQKAAGVPEHLRESTLRETATALGSAIINRFSRPSTPVAGDTMAGFTPPASETPAPPQTAATPSAPAAAQNTPRDPNMQQALAQAQQSGAAHGAQASNMQTAQQDPSKAPPTTPDQVHGTGHSFGLSA